MTINALNSGAKVWLADFEDANTPLWENMVGGPAQPAQTRSTAPSTSTRRRASSTRLGDELATIVVRPRGWHLPEKHLTVDGRADLRLACSTSPCTSFHCAQRQLDRGSGPYFYLPKMESHLEARLWNDVFVRAQEHSAYPGARSGRPCSSRPIPAAFEMEEILYELREHSAGLNAGRWDYIFSVIKKFRTRGDEFLLPDRNKVTMTVPFMRAYTELLVRTCHKRGAHAIGGMAAFIPSRKDAEVNKTALGKVRDDKTREAGDGFDGSWVAHPDLVSICREVFDAVLGDRPNQLDKKREDVSRHGRAAARRPSTPGRGHRGQGCATTSASASSTSSRGCSGSGAVGIFNLMEDAATAEIAAPRCGSGCTTASQLDTGATVTRELVEQMADEEMRPDGSATRAAVRRRPRDVHEVAVADEFAEFLTLPAYERMP